VLLRGPKVYVAVRDMDYASRRTQEFEHEPSPLHGASRAPAMAQGFCFSELDAQSQPVWHSAAGVRGQFWVSTEAEDAKHTHGGRGTGEDDRVERGQTCRTA